MCQYTQREYCCGHFRFIAAKWCNLYIRTHRRCPPHIEYFEYSTNEACSQCKQPPQVPTWRNPNRPKTPAHTTGISGIDCLEDCCRDLILVPWLGNDRRGSCTRRSATPAPGGQPLRPGTPSHRPTGVSSSGLYSPSSSTDTASTAGSSAVPSGSTSQGSGPQNASPTFSNGATVLPGPRHP